MSTVPRNLKNTPAEPINPIYISTNPRNLTYTSTKPTKLMYKSTEQVTTDRPTDITPQRALVLVTTPIYRGRQYAYYDNNNYNNYGGNTGGDYVAFQAGPNQAGFGIGEMFGGILANIFGGLLNIGSPGSPGFQPEFQSGYQPRYKHSQQYKKIGQKNKYEGYGHTKPPKRRRKRKYKY